MRARILCALLFLAGCSADPVASEIASWNTTSGPIAAPVHVAMSPVATLVRLDRPAYAIAIDAHDLYFTTAPATSLEQKPPAVMKCSKTGCETATPVAFGRTMPIDIAVDASNVYWLAPSEPSLSKAILSCPIDGCNGADPRLVVFQDPILDIASNGASLFWLGAGKVSSCDGSDCDATRRVVVSQVDAIQIDVDADTLYFRKFTDESIERCAIADCGTKVRLATDFGFTPFAFDQTNVYFRTPMGISRCAKTGCRKPALVAPLDQDASVTDIAADGARVYWIDRQSANACPITGCAKPFVISSSGEGVKSANRLALDGEYLYWTTGGALGPGAIFRVTK